VVRAGALSVTAAAVARGLDRPGLVLTNPPYGERVGGSGRHNDLRDLYASIGGALRGPLAGWSLGLLVADRSLAAQTGLSFEERFATSNGGIPVSFLLHERTA
jgi:23S rRNA (guanine2445-N2)-methyltransferase / 23S rRNA (guanine2069-N7)-methyltransferase